MNEKIYKRIWATINIILVVLIVVGVLWYVPYQISRDQHMVDTVNERAFQYNGTGTLTDLTEAEIMSNDADLNYENRVWKLQHQELYYLNSIVRMIVYSVGVSVICWWIFGVLPLYEFYEDDDEDDDEFDFNDEPPTQPAKEKDSVVESEVIEP